MEWLKEELDWSARSYAARPTADIAAVRADAYNLGTFLYDALTVIAHNHASTSNGDCFGC